jgi:hypothetical protein
MDRSIARILDERASTARRRMATGVLAILIPASGALATEELFGPPSPNGADEASRDLDGTTPLNPSEVPVHPVLDGDVQPALETVLAPAIVADRSAFDGCLLPGALDGSALDPACAADLLQQRYRGLRDHRERGQLVEEIDLGDGTVRRTETQVDCHVRDGRFSVSTTARRIRTFFGRMVPVRTGPGVDAASQEMDQWLVPHALLDRDANPSLDASAADTVRVADRDLIRLEFEGDGDRVELFVNPETVLVERARAERTLPDGGRWRGELDVETIGEVAPFEPATTSASITVTATTAAASLVAPAETPATFTVEDASDSTPATGALPAPGLPVVDEVNRFRD